MRRIIPIIIVLFLFSGCSITGGVVDQLTSPKTQMDKDQTYLGKAISEEDIIYCYSIQTQNIREDCFMHLAEELQDPSICNNLMGSLANSCKENIGFAYKLTRH